MAQNENRVVDCVVSFNPDNILNTNLTILSTSTLKLAKQNTINVYRLKQSRKY